MSYSRFFRHHMKQMVSAVSCSFLHQVIQTGLSDSDSVNSMSSSHKQLIINAFQDPLATIPEDSIHVVELPKSKRMVAYVSGIPFFGRYEVKVSTMAIKDIAHRSKKGLSTENALSAIAAHEAIHAKEHHEFFIMMTATYLSLTLFYRMQQFTRSLPVLIAACSSLYTLSYRALSRQGEYRADKMAILNHPELKEALKETLNVLMSEDDGRNSFLHLLDDHPSISARLARLP